MVSSAFRGASLPCATSGRGPSAGIALHSPDATVAHAQLAWGSGLVMPSTPGLGDTTFDLGPVCICLATDDPDSHHNKTVAGGAEIAMGLVDQDYGSREYGAPDPEGNVQCFDTYRPGVAANWASLPCRSRQHDASVGGHGGADERIDNSCRLHDCHDHCQLHRQQTSFASLAEDFLPATSIHAPPLASLPSAEHPGRTGSGRRQILGDRVARLDRAIAGQTGRLAHRRLDQDAERRPFLPPRRTPGPPRLRCRSTWPASRADPGLWDEPSAKAATPDLSLLRTTQPPLKGPRSGIVSSADPYVPETVESGWSYYRSDHLSGRYSNRVGAVGLEPTACWL